MTTPLDCSQNTDPLKLVREGTSQDGRLPKALDPAYAPVNERTVAHSMVFAQSYAALLKYFDKDNIATGDWVPFFGKDVSVQLAIAVVEDVEAYKANTKSWFDYLNNLQNQSNLDQLKDNQLKDRFGYLYSTVATLAQQLDNLKEHLPADIALKGTLQNLVKSQLAADFKRLIAYYKAGFRLTLVNPVVPSPTVQVLRGDVVSFASVLSAGLSEDWSEGPWPAYVSRIEEDASVYGNVASVFVQINHCSTHNLFTSVFDQFLKVFARVIGEAKTSLGDTLTDRDTHEPHYALYLAFLRLFEYARKSSNTLTQRHLDFYYREILRFKEKGAEPGHVHLLAELAKQVSNVSSHEIKAGELFKAGKDDRGRDVVFANDSDLVANQAKVAALKTVYRHGEELVGSISVHKGRLFASLKADSDDGVGPELTSPDKSWHPFYNKVYADGALVEIRMPEADVGFAIASHYLSMVEGHRQITARIAVSGYSGTGQQDFGDDIRCFLTTEKGWLEAPSSFKPDGANMFVLSLEIIGTDAPITRYSAKTHGDTFQTNLPMLLVKLKHDDNRSYAYSELHNVVVTGITLEVKADNVKSLAVSNDFGPVDTSKPFQPFGPSPVTGNSLIIGSKEIFQKELISTTLSLRWLTAPKKYSKPPPKPLPTVSIDFLSEGQWKETSIVNSVGSTEFPFTSDLDVPVLDEADFGVNEYYSTQSRQGFAKLKLKGDFGQDAYQSDLIKYLRKVPKATYPGKPPVGPTASALSMGYVASSELNLNKSSVDNYEKRPGQFFHLAPFGTAEQHPYLNPGKPVHLLPQFDFQRDNATLESEAELYIGISGLQPPQNLSLLFQVVAATANPMVPKPKPHIDWGYLKNNEWTEFAENEVQDGTGELLNSGIITFAIPREATSDNTIIRPNSLIWIRAAVHEKSDAVCKLQRVAAQAMQATFVDRGNSPDFAATPLAAETISKLDKPDSAVKTISQPFPSFGGRGAEKPTAFSTRISERLRHKDRAIDLWDYERLVLEAFPQIYKVKCLNHTHYDEGIYRELAPGHVTIVTIPNMQIQNLRNPLKPFTSLGVLQQIQSFLKKRTSCFVRQHVKNPQFEEVRVRFKLRLHDGFDESYYSNLLKQEITRFLSPWAFAKEKTVSIKLGSLPDEKEASVRPSAAPGNDVFKGLGLTLAPASSVQGAGNQGVVVADIDSDGAAAQKGMQVGDVILEAGGQAVSKPADVAAALAEAKKDNRKAVLLRVKSGDGTRDTPSFGGKIYKSVLINFVEDQPYVDYVTDFQVFQDIGGAQGTSDLDEVEGSRAVSILVSVPAGKHEITIIKDLQQTPSGESCLCEA